MASAFQNNGTSSASDDPWEILNSSLAIQELLSSLRHDLVDIMDAMIEAQGKLTRLMIQHKLLVASLKV